MLQESPTATRYGDLEDNNTQMENGIVGVHGPASWALRVQELPSAGDFLREACVKHALFQVNKARPSHPRGSHYPDQVNPGAQALRLEDKFAFSCQENALGDDLSSSKIE